MNIGTEVLNTKTYDEVYKATNDEAFRTAKLLAKKRGHLRWDLVRRRTLCRAQTGGAPGE